MAFDKGLAQRIEMIYSQIVCFFEEKPMFGGLSAFIGGNVAWSVIGDELCVRVGQEDNQENLEKSYAQQLYFTGKAMSVRIFVSPKGLS